MSEDNEVGEGGGLPESVELAWGLRERPGKGPKRALSLKGIVEAAVRVGSSEGLEAVSMSRVAAEAGASTMALYRYVSSKNDLLMLVFDQVMGEPPPLPGPERGWREGLSAWAWAMRGALRRHPWILRVPITGPPVMPNNVAWMEAALRATAGMGLPGPERVGILLLLSGYVRTEATMSHDLETAFQASSTNEREMLANYGALLASLTDPVRFPELHGLIKEGVFGEAGGPDDDFVFGLERLLDGMEALVREQGRG